ncbi:hypothetical protein G6F68_020524 [Rhizopus microsporus]|nr:hypothetical protein G6F68_020524 [Rhizopus microsporus]
MSTLAAVASLINAVSVGSPKLAHQEVFRLSGTGALGAGVAAGSRHCAGNCACGATKSGPTAQPPMPNSVDKSSAREIRRCVIARPRPAWPRCRPRLRRTCRHAAEARCRAGRPARS